MEHYIISHPGDVFGLESLLSVVGGEHRPQVERALQEFRKRKGIFKPLLLKDSFRPGCYRLNPGYKTLEQMRKEAEMAGKERVHAGTREWKPTESPLSSGEHPSLPHRRRHFRSIVDRMQQSPLFSQADIDLLLDEAPHFREPLKEAQAIQGGLPR